MKPRGFLVCARADAPLKAAGSSFERFCSKCLTRVMVAPSGTGFLDKMPDVDILCLECFFSHAEPGAEIQLAAEPKAIAQEFASAEPNDWRQRN